MRSSGNLEFVRNEKACGAFQFLIAEASRELRSAQIEPIVIASCPYKFNDAGNDEAWQCVRIGTFRSERSEYFEYKGSHEQRLREGPDYARKANDLLQKLEAADWRAQYAATFLHDMHPEEVLALVVQDQQSFLIVAASNNGEDAAYEITESGRPNYCGRPLTDPRWRRFDQRLNLDRPLLLWRKEDELEHVDDLVTCIEVLEASAPGTAPDWWTTIDEAAPGVPSSFYRPMRDEYISYGPLTERLAKLADTGRVSEAEMAGLYEAIRELGADR